MKNPIASDCPGCSCCQQGTKLSVSGPYFKYICDYFARPHKEVDGNECCEFKYKKQDKSSFCLHSTN